MVVLIHTTRIETMEKFLTNLLWEINAEVRSSQSFLYFLHVRFQNAIYSHLKMWCVNDDVIKWKRFPRDCPYVRGIHRSPVNSPHKGQWREALMFSLICAWLSGWVNNRESGDSRRHHPHYDVTAMWLVSLDTPLQWHNDKTFKWTNNHCNFK